MRGGTLVLGGLAARLEVVSRWWRWVLGPGPRGESFSVELGGRESVRGKGEGAGRPGRVKEVKGQGEEGRPPRVGEGPKRGGWSPRRASGRRAL